MDVWHVATKTYPKYRNFAKIDTFLTVQRGLAGEIPGGVRHLRSSHFAMGRGAAKCSRLFVYHFAGGVAVQQIFPCTLATIGIIGEL